MRKSWVAFISAFLFLARSQGSESSYQLISKVRDDMCLCGNPLGGRTVMTNCSQHDLNQVWIVEQPQENYIDQESQKGYLVRNLGSGAQLRHGSASGDPVTTSWFDPRCDDIQDFIWSNSIYQNAGYYAIRAENNIQLNMDVFHGDVGISPGSSVVIFNWNAGNNQLWVYRPVA